MQRLRVRFSRGEEIKFISHLDIMRLWIRALTRAGMPLSYSEGFNPHPKISLAAPLVVGITSEAELIDIFLQKLTSPQFFTSTVNQELPKGINILQSCTVGLTLPALAAQVRFAEYQVKVVSEKNPSNIEQSITRLMALEHLPWQHQRDTGMHHYDLRTLVSKLWMIDAKMPEYTLGMLLRCDGSGSGRPEQVCAALGFLGHPLQMHRTQLILETS